MALPRILRKWTEIVRGSRLYKYKTHKCKLVLIYTNIKKRKWVDMVTKA